MAKENIKLAEIPWRRSWKEVTGDLHVSPDKGLNAEDLRARRRRFGPNRSFTGVDNHAQEGALNAPDLV